MTTPADTPDAPISTPPTPSLNGPSGHRPETAEEWEQIRRSVAMLPPGAWAMRREQSLHALAALLAAVRKTSKR